MPILSLSDIMSVGTAFTGRNDFGASEVSRLANFAYEQVIEASGANHIPVEALALSSTTSGGNRVALPADFNAPLSLTLYQGSTSTATTSRTTISIPLTPVEPSQLDAQQNQTAGGIPEHYTWYGTWLELFPSPNSAYSLQLRYLSKPGTLVNSTDTPVLDARWHQGIAYKLIELLEASRNNPEGEALGRNRYLNYVTMLDTDQGKRQKDKRGMHLSFARTWSDV